MWQPIGSEPGMIDIKSYFCIQGREPKQSADSEEKVHRLKGPGVWEAPGAAHMGGKTPIRYNIAHYI